VRVSEEEVVSKINGDEDEGHPKVGPVVDFVQRARGERVGKTSKRSPIAMPPQFLRALGVPLFTFS